MKEGKYKGWERVGIVKTRVGIFKIYLVTIPKDMAGGSIFKVYRDRYSKIEETFYKIIELREQKRYELADKLRDNLIELGSLGCEDSCLQGLKEIEFKVTKEETTLSGWINEYDESKPYGKGKSVYFEYSILTP